MQTENIQLIAAFWGHFVAFTDEASSYWNALFGWLVCFYLLLFIYFWCLGIIWSDFLIWRSGNIPDGLFKMQSTKQLSCLSNQYFQNKKATLSTWRDFHVLLPIPSEAVCNSFRLLMGFVISQENSLLICN